MSNSNASLIIAIICITLGFGSVVFGVKNIVFSKNNATDANATDATFVGGSKSSSYKHTKSKSKSKSKSKRKTC